MKIIILLGAPGVGKGTQSTLISQRYNIPIISTGQLLRDIVNEQNNTTNGSTASTGISAESNHRGSAYNKITSTIGSGKLVDDNLVTTILLDRLHNDDCKNGFILDGYPRTLDQVNNLNATLHKILVHFNAKEQNQAIINLRLDDNTILSRLVGRFECSNCGAIYNKVHKKPIIDNQCDKCNGTEFEIRKDDEEKTIMKRILVYKQETHDLIKVYSNKDFYKDIDANQDPDKIFNIINNFLQKRGFTP